MKKLFISAFVLFFITSLSFAQHVTYDGFQVFDHNSAQSVLDAQDAYIRALEQMTQRAIQIRHAVQPYREDMYQKARNGKFMDALIILLEVDDRYIHYVFDNKGISDMLDLGGDCAYKINNYELAILLYQRAKNAGEKGANAKLLNIFNSKINDARASYKRRDYSSLWNDVALAIKTGYENGECYFYYGACYEKGNNLKEAKIMYKQAKKKKYAPAINALKSLKKKH